MLPDGRRLGAHLALGHGLLAAADRAVEIGATALQVFSHDPTASARSATMPPDLPSFRARLRAGGVGVVAIHGSYLINLASPEARYHARSIALLAGELRAARFFGASIVNVHIGSHAGAGVEVGVARTAEAIRRALELDGESDPDLDEDIDAGSAPVIALENSSGGGSGIGVDLDELAAIAEALHAAGVPSDRVAFCLDTAHAWGAGHDLADPRAVDAFLAAFDRRIGLDRLPLIHLNDSKSERGSRLDRHEHLGAGRIGGAGLAHLLRHPGLAASTFILETPGMDVGYDAINLRRAIALATGQPLQPLPRGALSLRGSRTRAATLAGTSPGAGTGAGTGPDATPA